MDKRVKITFDHDSKMSDRELSLYSKELSLDAKGSDSWRLEIKPGDKIDCYDSTGFWYAGTVNALEVRDYQKESIQMAHVALRVEHPDGDKKDEDGKPFYGWNKEFDEWMPLYSARIAPF